MNPDKQVEQVTRKFNIATVQYPINWDEYLKIVHESAAGDPTKPETHLTVNGYVVVHGPGCYNHGIMITGEPTNMDRFVNMLALVLQPGKYSEAHIDDPAVKDGQFERCERAGKTPN